MGSLSFKTNQDFYILGLWLADNYWRSGSVGLSSTSPILLERFSKFLKKVCPERPIKEYVYYPQEGTKRRHISRNIFVNSRPLTRAFMEYKHKKKLVIPQKSLPAYFAGRIDGDGHVDRKYRTGIRIVYSDREDASRDLRLLKLLNRNPASLYFYKGANTWVLYFRKEFLKKIQPKIAKFALKLRNL